MAELLQDIQPGLVGQAKVEENDIRPSVGDVLEAFRARVDDFDTVGRRGKHLAHLVWEQIWVIIDKEQVGHVTRASAHW
jgi:hypothetical protein